MKKALLSRRSVVFLAVMIFIPLEFSMPQYTYAVTLEELRTRLPKQFRQWSSMTADHVYTAENIFDYINGGAEVYRAYNMRHCLSRRYSTAGGPAIVLDIFDMGSSQDAYGIFTHDPEGEDVDLGQGGRLRPGWLNFWKDRFFISIYTEEETASALDAVKVLGKQIDALITSQGASPRILKLLPPKGLKYRSVRYLHHPMILNYHYYISDENLLQLSSQTDAVLASYQRGAEQALILLVSYPQPDAAAGALAIFKKYYLADADKDGMARLENKKWAAISLKDRLLTVVLEADRRILAENLLKEVKQKVDKLTR